ncbi:MAG: hypothetical protein II739_06105, partial [Clostridia bacterium]|nr:hypothetical protein [Clostridia bacterium]
MVHLLKALWHKSQLVNRFMCTCEGVVDSENVIGVPSAERLLVNNSGTLTENLCKLCLVSHGDNGLNCGVALRL